MAEAPHPKLIELGLVRECGHDKNKMGECGYPEADDGHWIYIIGCPRFIFNEERIVEIVEAAQYGLDRLSDINAIARYSQERDDKHRMKGGLQDVVKMTLLTHKHIDAALRPTTPPQEGEGE
jgi:hypothetical protein